MKTDFYAFRKSLVSMVVLFILVVFAGVAVASAQTLKEPERQQLLNNLKLLVWSDANSSETTVKLRIHSGAAFDPRDKAGAMRLLADSLFPDDAVKNYFTEELGGRLGVEANYDYIEITARGKNENFLDILEAVRNAVTNPPLTAENFKKVRDARLKILSENAQTNETAADLIVRKRVFGDFFPYSRPSGGTAETVGKIERADLLQLRDRFLTADNATLVIVGSVKPGYAHRAVRQLFGAWQKSDKPVPPTFRQPEAVEKTVLYVKQPSVRTAEIRFAVRGAARGTADDLAANIAADILNERWQKALPAELRQTAFVRHEANLLPGILIFGASVAGGYAEPVLPAAQAALQKTLAEPIAAAEFERAKAAHSAKLENDLKSTETTLQTWLDADTYKIAPTNKNAAVTLKNVQDLIGNWQTQTFAAVAITQGEGNVQSN